MDLTACVTHFDGDPFLLNLWLKLYDMYWKDEVDVVYLSIAYNPNVIPENVINYEKELISKYPKIKLYLSDRWELPEKINAELIKEIQEPYIMLLESDGLVFGSGMVKRFFTLLQNETADIVCSQYPLITYNYFTSQGFTGLMRNFFFIKKAILDKIDIDFYPKKLPIGTILPNTNHVTTELIDLDCFGWVSLQLATLKPKIAYIQNNNLHPNNFLSSKNYIDNKYLHIRQMSSSALGLGGGEFGFWLFGKNYDKAVKTLGHFDEHYFDGSANFIYLKACVFKLLAYDVFEDKQVLGKFAEIYKYVYETAIDWLNLDREKIAEAKGFYRGVMGL